MTSLPTAWSSFALFSQAPRDMKASPKRWISALWSLRPDAWYLKASRTNGSTTPSAPFTAALGCAVHSKLSSTQGYTTLELKIAYHRALTKDSGTVRAEATVISMGRRAAFAEGRLTDKEGRLCASATSTLLVFDR
jgi:hypothetical protein